MLSADICTKIGRDTQNVQSLTSRILIQSKVHRKRFNIRLILRKQCLLPDLHFPDTPAHLTPSLVGAHRAACAPRTYALAHEHLVPYRVCLLRKILLPSGRGACDLIASIFSSRSNHHHQPPLHPCNVRDPSFLAHTASLAAHPHISVAVDPICR